MTWDLFVCSSSWMVLLADASGSIAGCPSGYWGDPATTGCNICPTNSTRLGFTAAATTECKCDKGFYWDTTAVGICFRCAEGPRWPSAA